MEYLNRIWVFNYTAVLLGLSSQYVQVSNIISVDADDIFFFLFHWSRENICQRNTAVNPVLYYKTPFKSTWVQTHALDPALSYCTVYDSEKADVVRGHADGQGQSW